MSTDTQLVNSSKAQSLSKYGKGKRSLSHNLFRPPPLPPVVLGSPIIDPLLHYIVTSYIRLIYTLFMSTDANFRLKLKNHKGRRPVGGHGILRSRQRLQEVLSSPRE